MSAGHLSRHLLCDTFVDGQGRLCLGERRKYVYRDLVDNRYHRVAEGDTIFTLAAHYFDGIERPGGLFWIIADFQPTPVHDVTIPLELGRLVAIPSLRTVMEEVFNPSRDDVTGR